MWARERFTRVGLIFPSVRFVFHDTTGPCDGHFGIYWLEADELDLCALNKRAIVHELAHAWAHEALNDQERAAFVEHRRLEA